MMMWTLTFFSLFFGLSELKPLGLKLKSYFTQSKALIELKRSVQHLKLLQEILESGLVPEREDWEKIQLFPAPWGELLFQSVSELRSQGAPVLPSLHRMQKTLEEQTELILEGKVKSAQAFGQAVLGIVLVPIFSVILFFLLPEVQQSMTEYLILTLFSLFLGAVSFIWMISLADQARFASIRSENRKWMVSVNVTLERLMALIATGLPPDLAWKKTIEELSVHDFTLAREWKGQVWDQDFTIQSPTENDAERLILNLGTEIRRSIQTSLIEGRACLDRIESIHRAYLLDLKMKIGRELSLLPNRCLKPLFLLVLPSVMILMIGAMVLTMKAYHL